MLEFFYLIAINILQYIVLLIYLFRVFRLYVLFSLNNIPSKINKEFSVISNHISNVYDDYKYCKSYENNKNNCYNSKESKNISYKSSSYSIKSFLYNIKNSFLFKKNNNKNKVLYNENKENLLNDNNNNNSTFTSSKLNKQYKNNINLKDNSENYISSSCSSLKNSSNSFDNNLLNSNRFILLIKERHYFKVLLIILAFSLMLCLILDTVLISINNNNFISCIFPSWINFSKYNNIVINNMINNRLNINNCNVYIRYFYMILSFTILVLSIYFNIKFLLIKLINQINLKIEFKLLPVFYIINEIIYKLNYYFNNSEYINISNKLILCFIIFNNLIIVLISTISLINVDKYCFLTNYSKECATDFNLLLITKPCYTKFNNYLKKYSINLGYLYLQFYTELITLKNYMKLETALQKNILQCRINTDNKISNNTDNINKINLFNEFTSLDYNNINILKKNNKKSIIYIYNKYLNANSNTSVELPEHITQSIHMSYTKNSKNQYTKEWDEVLVYLYETLKSYYYEEFKNSNDYFDLLIMLEEEENINLKFILGSIIEN